MSDSISKMFGNVRSSIGNLDTPGLISACSDIYFKDNEYYNGVVLPYIEQFDFPRTIEREYQQYSMYFKERLALENKLMPFLKKKFCIDIYAYEDLELIYSCQNIISLSFREGFEDLNSPKKIGNEELSLIIEGNESTLEAFYSAYGSLTSIDFLEDCDNLKKNRYKNK